jgi:hypothetical protein
MRTYSIRSIITYNKSTTCAYLNFITNTVIKEDLYKLTADLFSRYIKKEFFNSTMICFSPVNNNYNTIVIILFNNADLTITYLKNLKEALLEEYTQSEQEQKTDNAILFSIEEIETTTTKLFSDLIDEKLRVLVDYLKLTVCSSPFVINFRSEMN